MQIGRSMLPVFHHLVHNSATRLSKYDMHKLAQVVPLLLVYHGRHSLTCMLKEERLSGQSCDVSAAFIRLTKVEVQITSESKR